MAKKPAKPSKTAAKTPAKPAPKAHAAAPAKAAAKPAEEPAKPAQAAAPKPAVPPKPVPAHQQFLSKGVQGGLKPQHMSKGRIFRHQGR
jgi:hypothetical protein